MIPIGIQDQGGSEELENAINDIQYPDSFLEIGTVQKIERTVSIAENSFKWRINQIQYLATSAFSQVINPATDGYYRIDLIVANELGGYQIIQGVESLDIVRKPDLLPDTLEVTFIPVYGNTIGNITPIIDSSVTKQVSDTLFGNGQMDLVKGHLASGTDFFRIRFGQNDFDNGELEIATSDNGNEPIFVRQYTYTHLPDGTYVPFNAVLNELALLDSNGDTRIPNNLYVNNQLFIPSNYYTIETTDELLKGKANYFLAVKPITGISYNVIIEDVLNELIYDGTLPMNVVIPNNATVPFPIGTVFYTVGTNTGVLSVSGGVGVVFQTAVGLGGAQNEVRKYTKRGVNTWGIEGGVSPAGITGAKKPNTLFLSSTGNDAKAIPTDSSLPFLTLNACHAWLFSQSHLGEAWTIETLDNGVFYLTTLAGVIKDFSITNNTSAKIHIQTGYSCSRLSKFVFTQGSILYIDSTNSSIFTPDNFFSGNGTLDHDIYRMEFSNLRTDQVDVVGRGYLRGVTVLKRMVIHNLYLNPKCFYFGEWGPTDGQELEIINIYDYNGGYNNYTTWTLSVENYYNYSGKNIYIGGKSLTISNIVSSGFTVTLDFKNIQLKRDATFQNTAIQGCQTNLLKIFNGNGNKLTFNNGVSCPAINLSAGPARQTATGFDVNSFMTIQNVEFIVPIGSVMPDFMRAFDFRDQSRKGGQIIFDNVVFLLKNNAKLLAIENAYAGQENFDSNIIFKNYVRIENNNYLIQSDATTLWGKTIVKMKNATIFHDFGIISANTNVQTTITEITSTY